MVERQGILATGQLGPRANEAAFTAPGRAAAALGKTASDIQFRFTWQKRKPKQKKRIKN